VSQLERVGLVELEAVAELETTVLAEEIQVLVHIFMDMLVVVALVLQVQLLLAAAVGVAGQHLREHQRVLVHQEH